MPRRACPCSNRKVAWGEHEALEVTLRDENSGAVSTDILVGVDVIELTERAEKVEVTEAMRAAPITIDFGEAKKGETSSLDFDTISFEGSSGGILTINGAIQDNGTNLDLSGLGSIGVMVELLATATGSSFAPGQARGGTPFPRAENITLTDHDDTLWIGDLPGFLAGGFETEEPLRLRPHRRRQGHPTC